MAYWWDGMPSERFWVEIRKVPGIGEEIYTSIINSRGRHDPRWDLVSTLKTGQVVFHYDADESRFVGFSTVAEDARTVGDKYRARLTGFRAIEEVVGLQRLREVADELFVIRDEMVAQYGRPLFLPFQFTADRTQFRMLSNYFTKISKTGLLAIFGARSLESWGLDISSGPSMNPNEGVRRPPVEFLKPFRPKADTDYLLRTDASVNSRTRHHETLVNDCATWLESKGYRIGRNAAVDLAVVEPLTIIEAKTTRDWTRAIRDGVSQLYEYRYFRVTSPGASLLLLTDDPPPPHWLRYLEKDRGIGAIWRAENGFELSRRAARDLQL